MSYVDVPVSKNKPTYGRPSLQEVFALLSGVSTLKCWLVFGEEQGYTKEQTNVSLLLGFFH